MPIALFAPPAENPFTGGHRYNAQVAAGDGVELRTCRDADLGAALAALAPDAVAVLDSLFLLTLAADHPALQRCLWLVHLLPDADPNRGLWEREELAPRVAAALRASAGAIATSEFTANAIRARAPRPVRTCTPGVDAPVVARAPASVPHVLTVANFEPRKGLLDLATCLIRVADLPWHWDIVGAHDSTPGVALALRRALQATGLSARATLHGALPPNAIAALRARAACFALLSRDEPYGMVFAEAAAHGLPSLAWDSGGVPETVTHDATGLLAPVGDLSAATANLRRLLTDGDLRARLGAGAAARTFQTWAGCATRFRACVSELMAEAAPA